jgi:hypothetical protein
VPEQLEISAAERTVWVGGIPETSASEDALSHLFSAFGSVEAVTVRVKAAAEHGPNRSWALVTFIDQHGAPKAYTQSSAAPITIESPGGELVALEVRPASTAELDRSAAQDGGAGALTEIWAKQLPARHRPPSPHDLRRTPPTACRGVMRPTWLALD